MLVPVRRGGGTGHDDDHDDDDEDNNIGCAVMLLPLHKEAYLKTIPQLINDDEKNYLFIHFYSAL